MRSQHIWKEKDADGRKREVRVTKFGGVWRFQAKYASKITGVHFNAMASPRQVPPRRSRRLNHKKTESHVSASSGRLASREKLLAPFHLGLAIGSMGDGGMLKYDQVAQAGAFGWIADADDVDIIPHGVGDAFVGDPIEDGHPLTIARRRHRRYPAG